MVDAIFYISLYPIVVVSERLDVWVKSRSNYMFWGRDKTVAGQRGVLINVFVECLGKVYANRCELPI